MIVTDLNKIFLFFISFSLIFTSCKKSQKLSEFKKAKNYPCAINLPLVDRIFPVPKFLISEWQKIDNKDNYESYIPTTKEKRIIVSNLKFLPPLTKKILKKRLVAIYFIKNIMGSGIADWVVDDRGKLFFTIIFNPAVLKRNLSQQITLKERSCFIKDKNYRVKIDVSKRYNGFLYILLHETAHIVDYSEKITPFVEKSFFTGKKQTPFVKGTWRDYSKPTSDFSFRKKVTFYGWNGGPKAKIVNAKDIYSELKKSNFVSLYGSLNWAEDFAEYVTFYHLTQKLGLPYIIKVYKKKRLIFKYQSMRNKRVLQRGKNLTELYHLR